MYRKFQKNRKFDFFHNVGPNFIAPIDFCHDHDILQYWSKAFLLYSCCLPYLRGVKTVGIVHFEHFWPNWPPSKMPNNLSMGKKLWISIVVYHDHDKNRLEWKIGANIVKKSQIFDFFEISYTFTLNFPYKIWPSGGGVKWPPMMPKFFFLTLYDICA